MTQDQGIFEALHQLRDSINQGHHDLRGAMEISTSSILREVNGLNTAVTGLMTYRLNHTSEHSEIMNQIRETKALIAAIKEDIDNRLPEVEVNIDFLMEQHHTRADLEAILKQLKTDNILKWKTRFDFGKDLLTSIPVIAIVLGGTITVVAYLAGAF